MKRIKERAVLTFPLLIPMIIFLVLLQLAIFWAQEHPGSSIWPFIAAAPLIPAGFLVVGIIRIIKKLDELERKILVDAAALSGLVMFVLLIYLGMLSLAGSTVPNPIYLALLMAIIILTVKLLGNRASR